MARFYLPFSLLIVLLFLSLMMALTASAKTQPTHAALRDFKQGCAESFGFCWHGIALDYTPTVDAEMTLRRLGYRYQGDGSNIDGDFHSYQGNDCALRLYHHDNMVTQIDLYNCRDLYLGDVIHEFDEPLFFHMSAEGRGMLAYLDWHMGVYFQHGLALHEPVDYISINVYLSGTNSFEWYGYLPYWMYCQIHWDNYGCSPL